MSLPAVADSASSGAPARRKPTLRRAAGNLAVALKRARGKMENRGQRLLGAIEALFVDHAIFRVVYANRFRVSDRMWRSSQPSPRQIRAMARRGIKTIINLRGERDCAAYLMEMETARQCGIEVVDYPIRSREPPSKEALRGLKNLFDSITYPALLHCKVGSDRAGMMSALYLLVGEGRPVEEAQKQLSPRFGHVKQSKAGVLDRFFEEYKAHRDRTGDDFMTWVETVYDPVDMKKRFRSQMWANILYDRILKRE
ncbi:MAG TPA: tyrosine-protein phosphatase [Azospirillaceae bacterium]|nr:tyrosine-protein phosphatase [Azospirillaceae bacterium]